MARVEKRKFTAYTPLSESGARPSERTDRGRVYNGVALIKAGLGNRRDRNFYPPEVLKEAVDRGLFDGLRAFADHPDSVSEEIQPERTIRDMVGVYENARFNESDKTVRADLRILKSQSWLSDTIDELLEIGHGDKIGLSINGRGQTTPERMRLAEAGDEEVEVNRLQKFLELRSTDVVTEAGAGGGFSALLESARRAKETTNMGRDQMLAALREAVRKGDLDEAKELEAKLAEEDETDETDTEEACGGKKRMAEAEEVDHDEELEEATEEAKSRADDDSDEEDEDAEDLDEAESDDDDLEEAGMFGGKKAAPFTSAVKKQKAFAKEAAIKAATGKPTGTVQSGSGSYVKPAKRVGKSSMVAKPKKLSMREANYDSGETGLAELRAENAVLRERLASCKAKGERLSEALRIRSSADRAKKLLRESNLPKSVRPHLIDSLLGQSDEEMRREIQRQERIIEAAAQRVKEDLLGDDFESVEGAGSTIRESFTGSRDGNDLGDILAEVGLPMKR
jgi:hypothetical protein